MDRLAVTLERGQDFTITGRPVEGSAQAVSTTYEQLARDVRPGDRILLDDGLLVLRVKEVAGLDVRCEVMVGGALKNNKGINIPGAALSVATITDKDFQDAEFGIAQGVDFIAMSFVRQASDIHQLREYLRGKNASLPIVAKIEKPQAIARLDEILAGDGIDVYFIGPVDLSKSMGHAGDYGGPDVAAGSEGICRRAEGAGRHAGNTGQPGDPPGWRRAAA